MLVLKYLPYLVSSKIKVACFFILFYFSDIQISVIGGEGALEVGLGPWFLKPHEKPKPHVVCIF